MQICAKTVRLYKSDFEVRIGILVISSSSFSLAIVAILRIWIVLVLSFLKDVLTLFSTLSFQNEIESRGR